MDAGGYDPFEPGRRVVGAASFEAKDAVRERLFPCEFWYPEAARAPSPLIVFSHYSGGSRTASSFLCTHLASHGYIVAAMDHSEVVAPELAPRQGETPDERLAPATKRMFILRRADHQHFVDDVEASHEELRAMTLPGAAAWIPGAMLPISQLCSGAQAHLFVRGLTLSHLDAALRRSEAAERFFCSDVQSELAARGVDAVEVTAG